MTDVYSMTKRALGEFGNAFEKKVRCLPIGFVIGVLAISACASGPGEWRQTDDAARRSASISFAADSSLAGQLNRQDREALSVAFIDAMSNPEEGKPFAWTGGNAKGQVSAGEFLMANVLPDPQEVLGMRGGISVSYMLETEQGEHVLLKNSNVRLGPSTERTIAETLPSGTGVEGIGLVQNEPWMMIAINNQVRGYVHKSLLEKAPGADRLELAGGPLRKPYLCREFTQNLAVGSQKDRWQGMACDFGEGWELAAQGGPTLLGNDGF